MEHAKKMILLPHETFERLQRQQCPQESLLKSVQTPGTPVSRLDAELGKILYTPPSEGDVDEREKWLEFNKKLQRYLHFRGAEIENVLGLKKKSRRRRQR